MHARSAMIALWLTVSLVSSAHAGGYHGYSYKSHGGHYQHNNAHRGAPYRSYSHGRHHDHYAVLGGLLLGAFLGHALTRASDYHRPNGYTSSPSRYWQSDPWAQEPVAVGPLYAPGRYSERLLRDLTGNCYLVSTDASGRESRLHVSPSECY